MSGCVSYLFVLSFNGGLKGVRNPAEVALCCPRACVGSSFLFLPHSKDMQVRVIGHSKLPIVVNVGVNVFVPPSQPSNELASHRLEVNQRGYQ